jgi:hypothetical protein
LEQAKKNSDYVQYNRSSLVPFLTQIKTNEQAKNQYLTKWSEQMFATKLA